MKLVNGRPSVPVLDEQSLPKFLHSKRLENSVNRSSTRLKLFSGLANPALAKVSSSVILPFSPLTIYMLVAAVLNLLMLMSIIPIVDLCSFRTL